MMLKAREDDPSTITLIHSQRIRGVTGVLCGDSLPSAPLENAPVITCKFRVRYWTYDAHMVAKMVKRGTEWEIADALTVTRKRHS